MTDYNFYELIDDPDIQADIKAKKKKKFHKDNPPEKIKSFMVTHGVNINKN